MNAPARAREYARHAEILRCDSEDDTAHVCWLRDQGHEVIDTLRAQLGDLVRTLEPGRKMDETQTREAVDAFIAARGPDYGVWAHFPWARRLVRVLEEPEFVALRTDRNRQKITAAEHELLRTKKVGVVGLSVGQAVALTFAMERSCGELRLADFDAIDLSNLNRLRCGVHELGLPKTVVAARQIAELDPYLKVVCFDEGYGESNAAAFLDGLNLVVDECDSLDVKLRLRQAARARGIPVVMNTSDRGMTDIERFDLEPGRPLFHGKLGDMDPELVADLSTEEKVPIVLDIIGMATSSVRLRASMLEIEQSIKTWPQLASDVALGGAAVCDAGRRLLLGMPVASGRYYLDPAIVGRVTEAHRPPPETDTPHVAASPPAHPCNEPCDRIVADAALAPSAGNAQPWQWRKQAEALVLCRREGLAPNTLDPSGKAATVGLGASLETALISASHYGFSAHARVDVESRQVATLVLTPCEGMAGDALYPQIARRRSVRTRPGEPGSIAARDLEAMTAQVAGFPGMNLTWLTRRADIEAAAALAGAAERLRFLDPRSHAELLREIGWSYPEHRRTGEGLPLAALSLTAAEETGLRVLRDPEVVAKLAEWDLGAGLAKLSREVLRTSAAVGLLWCEGDSHLDYFTGGRALQRLWLQATQAGIGLCPVVTLCYMLAASRSGRGTTALQARDLPAIERDYVRLFGLPERRADIALFRLVPAAEELDMPRVTLRRPR